MGWKASALIISGSQGDPREILHNLGFSSLEQIDGEAFDTAIYPEYDQIFIGYYKNNLIITLHEFPAQFFKDSLTAFEGKLIELFPKSEICAFSLDSTYNHWGFAVIKDGKKIRVKAGDINKGTFIDFGVPLEQEFELLSKSKINEAGKRLYYLDSLNDDPYNEDQVGENIIFDIVKRFTGIPLDQDDDFLFESLFTGYRISESFLADAFFTDKWEGSYFLGAGYKDKYKGLKENFFLEMQLVNGELSGTCIDEDKQADIPAVIQGFIIDTFIGFIKEYATKYVIDESGVKNTNSKSSHKVAYSGLFDPITQSFKGVWKIDKTSFWGEWVMKKKNQKDH